MAALRRILAFDRVSADGYFAAPDGSLDWVVQDPEVDREGAAGIPGVDTILFGRRTYERFASFWPNVALDAADAPDPHAPRRSQELLAFARFLGEASKIVFSRTLKEAAWRGSHLRRGIDARAIEASKREPGKDMIIFGSGSVVSQLAEHGLIDEYQLVVSPLLLGGGQPLVSGLPRSVRLELVAVKQYPSGNVMLRYARPT
jgi:dihydrofolate reductase